MKVTCLCLTRNRRHWLPQAIRCFQDQTYPDKELVIVADGESVRDLIPETGDIHLTEVADQSRIGVKRNLGCSLATGGWIALWDDDDFSAPRRLAVQVERLQASGKAVTGYRGLPFTNGKEWWQYFGAPDFAIGSSLLFRRDWWQQNPFEPVQVGEDTAFVDRASQNRQLVTVADDGLMAISIHAGNTSPRSHRAPRTRSWQAIEAPPLAALWQQDVWQQEALCSST